MKRLAIALFLVSNAAFAGPETALREFAGGQVKKGVRTIGMGGDGATTGNYALVYKDAGGAIFDEGIVHFTDTNNFFSFSGVGVTTPSFWNGSAFYVIALGQHATGVRTWSLTSPSPSKPPSTGNLSDTSVFIKFAKPLGKQWSIGFMGAYELSQATLLPDNGAPPIRFDTSYRPSGGFGVHWHPDDHWQFGARVILNHDWETRSQGGMTKQGLLRAYEYRLGGAYAPWNGTLIDVGIAVLDRSNDVDGTTTLEAHPTIGAEQALVKKKVWARVGLDETTFTTGLGFAFGVLKLDLAYLYDLAAARTSDVFGKRNASLIGTIALDYEKMLSHK